MRLTSAAAGRGRKIFWSCIMRRWRVGLGCVWTPSYEDYTMRTGLRCHRWSRGYSRKLHRGEFSVQEKMGPGQGRPKRGQKRKGVTWISQTLTEGRCPHSPVTRYLPSSDLKQKRCQEGKNISIMLPWKDIPLQRTGFSDFFILSAILHQV